MGVLVALAAAVISIWACCNWVLGPLNRAAQNRQYPIQYSLADLLCLFVLVQLPVGIVRWVFSIARIESGEVICDVLIGIVATLLWWNCARLLSLAGVHTVWRRCVFLALVVPGLIAGPVAIFLLAVRGLDGKNVLYMLAAIPVVGIVYGLGRFTRAIVASAKEEPPRVLQEHDD